MSSDRAGLRRTTRLLGLASVGLGAPMVRSPREVARIAGVDDDPRAVPLIVAVGVRELLSAVGLLAGRPRWTWSRVAGDAMDLTVLGAALSSRRGKRERRVRRALGAVAGIAALDLLAAARASTTGGSTSHGSSGNALGGGATIEVFAATTVNRPAQEVYEYWRDLERLPTFMAHVREVRSLDDRRSHWVAEAPGRRTVQWDAEVVEDSPGRLLRWRSTGRAVVANEGTVEFRPAPGDRGTEVRVRLRYAQPGGRVGKAVAKLFGEAPDQQIRDDLTRFKQVLETGQVVRSEGTPEGPMARRLLRQRPAVPLS